MRMHLFPSLKTIVAFVAVVVGLGAWYGVWLMQGYVVESLAQYQSEISSRMSAQAREAAQARVRSLAAETEHKRAALAKYVVVDPIEATKMIESVGVAARVTLRVNDVSPETIPLPPGSGARPLKAVGFLIEATGSFSAIMKAARLLETLPLPTAVRQLDIAQVPADQNAKGPPLWRLNMRIRLLTDSTLTS